MFVLNIILSSLHDLGLWWEGSKSLRGGVVLYHMSLFPNTWVAKYLQGSRCMFLDSKVYGEDLYCFSSECEFILARYPPILLDIY